MDLVDGAVVPALINVPLGKEIAIMIPIALELWNVVRTIVVPTFQQALIVAFFPPLVPRLVLRLVQLIPRSRSRRTCIDGHTRCWCFFNFFFVTFTTYFRHCVVFSLFLICFYVYYLEIQVLGNLVFSVFKTFVIWMLNWEWTFYTIDLLYIK